MSSSDMVLETLNTGSPSLTKDNKVNMIVRIFQMRKGKLIVQNWVSSITLH